MFIYKKLHQEEILHLNFLYYSLIVLVIDKYASIH